MHGEAILRGEILNNVRGEDFEKWERIMSGEELLNNVKGGDFE